MHPVKVTLNLGASWSTGTGAVVFEHGKPAVVTDRETLHAVRASGRFAIDEPEPIAAEPAVRRRQPSVTPTVLTDNERDHETMTAVEKRRAAQEAQALADKLNADADAEDDEAAEAVDDDGSDDDDDVTDEGEGETPPPAPAPTPARPVAKPAAKKVAKKSPTTRK